MDDNIHMEPYADGDGQHNSWRPSHILDFSDLSIGDPIYDLIPIYLDVFRRDTELFKKLLESYGLPLIRSKYETADSTRKKVLSPSYPQCVIVYYMKRICWLQCSVFGMSFGQLNHGNRLSSLFGVYLTPTDVFYLKRNLLNLFLFIYICFFFLSCCDSVKAE